MWLDRRPTANAMGEGGSRHRDELAAQAAETAASYTARLQSSDRSSPKVDGEPHPAATNSGGGDRKAK